MVLETEQLVNTPYEKNEIAEKAAKSQHRYSKHVLGGVANRKPAQGEAQQNGKEGITASAGCCQRAGQAWHYIEGIGGSANWGENLEHKSRSKKGYPLWNVDVESSAKGQSVHGGEQCKLYAGQHLGHNRRNGSPTERPAEE